MKKLSTYLFLILFSFSAPSFADDISDFQIEGMSIGDSLLDYFSEEKIKAHSRPDWYKNDKFTPVESLRSNKFETYEVLQIAFKTKDKKKLIYGIEGVVFYKDINKCENQLDEIINEFSKTFTEAKIRGKKKFDHVGDKTGESKVIDSMFIFPSGDKIIVGCLDWSEKLTKKNNWHDQLRIIIRHKEYSDFINYDAY